MSDNSSNPSQINNDELEHPTVFISYSWDGDEHKDWVRQLASHLRGHGVNVVLDQWDVRLGDDLPFFMEQGLSKAHLVLCICSSQYVEKANAGKGGAGYEKRILAADMLNDSNRRHIIPIIKNNHSESKLPIFLSGLLYLDFDRGNYYDCYRSLLERIFGEDIRNKPPLGENPFRNKRVSLDIEQHLELDQIKYKNILFEGVVSFDYKNNNGSFTIGGGVYEFKTHWSEAGFNSIHCYSDYLFRIGYSEGSKEFPSIDNISQLFDFSSSHRCLRVGDIVILENQYNHFAAVKILKIQLNTSDIGHLLEFEYKIYSLLV